MRDFLINLEVELIGVVITIFVVERIVRAAQEKRWSPSRHLMYVQIYEDIDAFLFEVIPMHLRELPRARYQYGTWAVIPRFAVDRTAMSHDALLISLFAQLKSNHKTRPKTLSKLQGTIDEIQDRWLSLLEPEEAASLQYLADRIRLMEEQRVDWREQADIMRLADWLAVVIEGALAVREWLENKADGRDSLGKWARRQRA